jgi:hypothetical protein
MVARWLELAATLARRFNATHLRGHELVELQLDELNTVLQSRKPQTWVFASIDGWSRLWPATLVGSRTYRIRSCSSEASPIRAVLHLFRCFYNAERPHQGLGNRVIDRPAEPRSTSLRLVTGHERLGGLLRHYRASA